MSDYYQWIKALHIISMTAWMAGMFYLPRLFVYHLEASSDKERKRFELMEGRLIKIIMNPAMLITIILGLLLSHIYGIHSLSAWYFIKVFFVLILAALHGYFVRTSKRLVKKSAVKSAFFYKVLNELVTVVFVVIVIMVVVKPFE
ncbi:MAG: protoporphyrinogen oxidase HemJ [Rickettsiales bacterium]